MDTGHRWNHVTYAVAPDHLALLETAIDALFPWVKFVAKQDLLGYRLADDPQAGAIYLRPVPAAAAFELVIRRLRSDEPALASALGRLDSIDPDRSQHNGFLVPTTAEWEERLLRAERLERERPELRVTVVDVLRAGDARNGDGTLHRAFIRLGLLGPLGNTIEMQARA